jgi:O-antigen/teichoic acid export membrane protein
MKIILKNIFSNWVVYGLNIIIQFVMTPIMVHYLGIEAYGIWLLINSISGYLGLFDVGLQSTTTKYVAQYIAEKDYEKLNKFNTTTFRIFLYIAIIVFGLTVILSGIVNNIFTMPDNYKQIVPFLLLIAGSQVSILFLFAVFTQIVSGMQRYEIHGIIGTINIVLRSFLIYFFLKKGYGLLAVALVGFGSTLFGKIPYIFIVRYLKVTVKISFHQFDRDLLKQVFNYSKISFFIMIATKLIFYTDNIIIGSMVSISGVAVYGIASSMIDYLRSFILSATNVLNPAASHAHEKDRKSLSIMALITTKYTTFIIIPVFVSFIFLGKIFLHLWLGKDFEETYIILVLLSLAQLFSLPFYGIGSMLYGIARHDIIAKTMIVEGVMNLILSIILAKYLGLVGVALGTAIPSIFLNLFVLPLRTTYLVDLSLFDYYVKGLLKPFSSVVPFVISLFVFKNLFGYNTWIQFISILSCSLLVHLIVVYLFDLQFILPVKYKILNKSA